MSDDDRSKQNAKKLLYSIQYKYDTTNEINSVILADKQLANFSFKILL